MIAAPPFAGVLRPSIFLGFSENLTPGVYSFTPQSRAPGATKVRFRGTAGGGGVGQTGTPGQSGGGGGGGYFDTGVLSLAPADLTTTISITVGAGGAIEVNGGDTTVAAAFVSALNAYAQGGRRGLDGVGGAGGTASGGSINTPGGPGLDATFEPPWTPGPSGDPNGGGGNGSLIIDWT